MVSIASIGFVSALAERIEPGEFLGEDHAGTFGISLVVGWTGESVDEAGFSARGRRLMAISRLVAEDRSRAVSAYRRRTGGSPRSAFAPRRAYRSVARCVAGRPR